MAPTYPTPDLSDDMVRLRRWSERDLDCVEQAGRDIRIPIGTTVPAIFSREAGLGFIHRQWQRIENGEGISLAITEASTDRAVGLVFLGVRPQAGVMGLGYWVVPDARGRGIGTRAVRLASAWALDVAGVARVEAWVEPTNAASVRLLVSAGFRREGLLRSFLSFGDRRADVIVFSRTAGEAETSGRPQRVIIVNGPAGVGKTTIAHRLAARVANAACIHGDALADFIVSRIPGQVEQGLGYVNGATIASNYIRAGYDLVVFDYCFEHPRHIQRFLDAYDGAAPASLFTLWAPLDLVQERERARTGRRRLGTRVEACYRSMAANLDELGEVVENLDDPERTVGAIFQRAMPAPPG